MFFRMMFVMMMFLLRQTLDASWFFRFSDVKILEDFSFGFLLVGNSSYYWGFGTKFLSLGGGGGDNNCAFLLLNESTKNHSLSLCFNFLGSNNRSLWVFNWNNWCLFRNNWCSWLHWDFFFLNQTFCLVFERHFILMFLVIFFLNQTRMSNMVVMLGKRHVFLWLLLNH